MRAGLALGRHELWALYAPLRLSASLQVHTDFRDFRVQAPLLRVELARALAADGRWSA